MNSRFAYIAAGAMGLIVAGAVSAQPPRAGGHWAYQAPVRPTLPETADDGWERNPIDRFVRERMQAAELQPNPEADRYTLSRRLHLDLLGLPPTIAEADAFVADDRPDAYERLVDRLLQDPAYGERMALHWLDLARYADSHGYQIDLGRSIWPYRDWVIRAFNANLPFDQFTIEQIAGDLLPNPSADQLIATGFNRNTMYNEEAGIDPEEYRVNVVAERVHTTMAVWMGQTMSCAQCHDHMYDPITQREFYELYAIFNNAADPGGQGHLLLLGTRADPVYEFPLDPPQDQRLSRLREELQRLQRYEPSEQDLIAWREETSSEKTVRWRPLFPKEMRSAGGATLVRLDDHSIRSEGHRPTQERVTVKAEVGSGRITAIRLEAMNDPSLPRGGPGRSENGGFLLSTFSVTAAPVDGAGEPRELSLRNATATVAGPNDPIEAAIDGDRGTGWAAGPIYGGVQAVFELAEVLELDAPAVLTFELNHNALLGRVLGKFRLSVTDAAGPVTANAPAIATDALAALKTPADQRTEAQRQRLVAHYRSRPSHITRVHRTERQIQQIERSRTHTLIMGDLDEPRETRLFRRGNFLDPGPVVQPSVPAIFHEIQPRGPRIDRLDLARWLVARENPLTARIAMNRLWMQLFGAGLVRTPEDLGLRSPPPTHPQLLDWLAVEFMESGWNLKHMARLIVTSATYRQAITVDADRLERDPDNRLLSRGPRFRLPAELIRDNALAIGGLLDRRIGGPSVRPHQQPGLWEERGLHVLTGPWRQSPGADSYRRGLYTFWRRGMHYPVFDTFDAPSREFCTIQRPRTNTPLQALITLNDPTFIEAARIFAERIMVDGGDTTDQRITYAFRRCLTRPPTPPELETLRAFHEIRLRYFQNHPSEAEQLCAQGQAPRRADLDPIELAAWTLLSHVLLNLDETITKG